MPWRVQRELMAMTVVSTTTVLTLRMVVASIALVCYQYGVISSFIKINTMRKIHAPEVAIAARNIDAHNH